MTLPTLPLPKTLPLLATLKKRREKTLGTRQHKILGVIEQLNLVDIENGNGTYTWTNRRSRHQQIAWRVDRFLISKALMLEGPMVESNILLKAGTNHWPILFWIDIVAALYTPGRCGRNLQSIRCVLGDK
jgi:exonuclease III